MRKLTKMIYKKSSFEVISSHALAQASSAKMCSTQKEATTNAMESATLSSTSAPHNELDSSSKESDKVSSNDLVPIGLNLADLASGGVSNRYTHIVSIEGERYVSVSLCFNTLEKSVRVYAYVKPQNIQQNVGPGNPYIVSGKLTTKSAAKIAKIL